MYRYTWHTFSRELVLLMLALVWLVPFYLLLLVSVKPTDEIFTPITRLPSRIALGNYAEAWSAGGLGGALVNSIVITVGTVMLLIASGSLAAYTIARRPGRLSGGMYLLFVLGIILPFQMSIIPVYSVLADLGLVGSYAGMILLYTGVWMPMAVFLYTGFVRALPKDYDEAAQVDGAGPFRTFRKVVFPQLRPVTATVALLCGILIWNDFFLQLIFMSGSSHMPLPVALYNFVGTVATRWNLVFAAVVVAIAPIVLFFVFAQKRLIQGFAGGIKS